MATYITIIFRMSIFWDSPFECSTVVTQDLRQTEDIPRRGLRIQF